MSNETCFFPPDDEVTLISAIKENSVLWDITHPDYSVKSTRIKTWERMQQDCFGNRYHVKQLKNKWLNLKRSWNRLTRHAAKSADAPVPSWKHWKAMDFLLILEELQNSERQRRVLFKNFLDAKAEAGTGLFETEGSQLGSLNGDYSHQVGEGVFIKNEASDWELVEENPLDGEESQEGHDVTGDGSLPHTALCQTTWKESEPKIPEPSPTYTSQNPHSPDQSNNSRDRKRRRLTHNRHQRLSPGAKYDLKLKMERLKLVKKKIKYLELMEERQLVLTEKKLRLAEKEEKLYELLLAIKEKELKNMSND